MADLFTTLNEVSLLLAGRRPEWLSQPDANYPNGAPDASSGVGLKDSPRTQVMVDLREEARHMIVRISIRELDLTDTYTVTTNGNAVAFDAAAAAAATRADVIQGIADAMNASAPTNTIVDVEVEDRGDTGAPNTVKIIGILTPDYVLAVPATAGAAEMDVATDATTASIQIWYALKPPIAAGITIPNTTAPIPTMEGKFSSGDWRKPNGAVYAGLDITGFVEKFDTAGHDRLYVEVTALTDSGGVVAAPNTKTIIPRVTIGPAINEVQT